MQATKKRLNPLVRAVMVMGAVMTLVTGVTFAALNDTATLTGNTIGTASANADLLLWDGDSFEPTAPGFNFEALTPGEKSDPFMFYFKNNGNVPLDVTAEVSALPTFSEGITADDVKLTFWGACHEKVSATLTQLNTEPVELPCNPLEVGAQGVIGEHWNEANYKVTAKVSDDVEWSEEGESVGAFDIVFNGTAAANN